MDNATLLAVMVEAVKNTVTDWRELLTALDNAAIATGADRLPAYDAMYSALYEHFSESETDNA